MNKEELLKEIANLAEVEGLCPDEYFNEKALNLIEGFLNQQTEQLKIELKKSLRDLEAEKSISNQFTEHIKHLQSQLSEKDKELSELKAKRKEEIEKAYKDGRISMISSSSEVAFMTPEQYYTQTYGQ